MSQAIPSAQDCCLPCEEPVVENIPGPQGPAGAAGAAGTDGENAFTTADSFTMPAELANVTVTVAESAWAVPGQIVAAGKAGSASFGYFEVISVPSATSLTLKNLEDTASGTYTGNSAPGTVFPNLTKIGPGGLQGPAGSSGAPASASYWTRVAEAGLSSESAMGALATGYVKVTTGTGSPSSQAVPLPNADLNVGVADNQLVEVDDAAGLTAGEMVRATAAGIESVTAATGRSALGLGTMATQAASAVAITGGAIDGTPVGAGTPSTGAFTTLSATGNVTHGAKTFLTSSAIQSLAAGSTLSPDATKVRVVGNGGAVTIGTTPSITNPVADGQLLIIMGTDNTNTVTFQRESALPGSKLRLGAATRVLGLYDTLTLLWDQTTGFWTEVAFVDNT